MSSTKIFGSAGDLVGIGQRVRRDSVPRTCRLRPIDPASEVRSPGRARRCIETSGHRQELVGAELIVQRSYDAARRYYGCKSCLRAPSRRTWASSTASSPQLTGPPGCVSSVPPWLRRPANRSCSWREIHDEARVVGAALQARGLVPGDHVAILGPTSRQLITIVQGCWLAGVASMVLPLADAHGFARGVRRVHSRAHSPR